jgi:hypothetical protein
MRVIRSHIDSSKVILAMSTNLSYSPSYRSPLVRVEGDGRVLEFLDLEVLKLRIRGYAWRSECVVLAIH